MNGVRLRVVEQGAGTPLVCVHGGLADYREWTPQIPRFASRHRVIAYSRRHNHPNRESPILPDHSAISEARDLSALIGALGTAPAHVVGYSYGAFVALVLALEAPELVRSLVLAEPPVHRWAPAAELEGFLSTVWNPIAEVFRQGDDALALRVTADAFAGEGAWETLPDEVRSTWRANVREWRALTTSRDPFPMIDADRVRRLGIPTLLLAGEKTLPVHRTVNDVLERLLPDVERRTLPGATHEMWAEQPETCGEIVLSFIAKHDRRRTA